MAMFSTGGSMLACCYSPPFPMRICTQRLQPGHGSALAKAKLASMLSGGRVPLQALTVERDLHMATGNGGNGCVPLQAVTVERDLHMATGDGENSYAVNSSFQRKTIIETCPELRKAVREVLKSLSPAATTMVAADLGCSSGPNTLLVVSELMNTISAYVQETTDNNRAIEVQFFLNDLPGNDFNLVFRSLNEHLHSVSLVAREKAAPPCYIAGLPGSIYTRIFPCQSVHLFHSSHCIIWRSKVPEDLSNGNQLNGGNIYIGKTTPQVVVKLFQEQFGKDFELFLKLRYEELVSGGHMVLTFVGQKQGEMPMQGGVARVWELLSEALQYLVQKGRVEKKKLSSFNMPYYAPSVDEVTQLIKRSNLFDIEDIRLFESNWDADDDSDGDVVLDCSTSAKNIAKIIRAIIEPLIRNQFGESILDELFVVYASILTKDLEKGKAMCPVILVTLKKSMHRN